AEILRKLSSLVSVEDDGHFATIVLFEVDPVRRSVAVVNAGHPSPILDVDGETTFFDVPTGVPVGVTRNPSYEVAERTLPAGATLLAFTDGLFERRGETVDDGLERLRETVAEAGAGGLGALLDHLVDRLTGTSRDDAAILAVRW